MRLSCGHGCGSIEIRATRTIASLGESGRGLILEAVGFDALGRRALVGIGVVDGGVTAFNISPLDSDQIAPPAPKTPRQVDAVPRGTLALNWLVPRTGTILEEAAARSG